jgi:hypothetical protein
MKLLEHPATTAFGAATSILLILLVPLASPTHTELYHLSGSVSSVLVPLLLNFAGVWLLLTLLLGWGRKHRWLNASLWVTLGVALPWMLMKAWFSLLRNGPIPRSANLTFLALLLIAAATVLALRPQTVTLLRSARRLAVTLLGFVALSGAIMLAEALDFAWQARHLNALRPLHQTAFAGVTAARRGRIIWIVFDELSYRQVYEHRYVGLELPAFDRLATEATVFTNTVPAGLFTEFVLPSLITGMPLDNVHSPAAGWPLGIHNSSTQTWGQLDPHSTVFQDALNAGYSTAVAGWFNPYCRILPEVLDHCFWTSHLPLPGGIFPGQSIGWNTEQPVLHHLLSISAKLNITQRRNAASNEVAFHQEDYSELLTAADKLLADPSVSFLLLHMPIPHPGGIYNRHTSTFVTADPTYLDNLALCDLYLAHVRQELERDGTWDNTTLVVMGDHSWRVQLNWARSPGWTSEEQVASDGAKFDTRPAYIVKLPHQTAPSRIETPFAALRTRELFDNLLTGRIATLQQLAVWAQQDNGTPPVSLQ